MSEKHRFNHERGHVHERLWEWVNGLHFIVPKWVPPAGFRAGDVVRWQGIPLRCTFEHYAGHRANDPWDPFHGWPNDINARSTWQPCGRLAWLHWRRLDRLRAKGVIR